jgi:hypothetical protein
MADEMVIKAYHRIDVTSDRKVPGQWKVQPENEALEHGVE